MVMILRLALTYIFIFQGAVISQYQKFNHSNQHGCIHSNHLLLNKYSQLKSSDNEKILRIDAVPFVVEKFNENDFFRIEIEVNKILFANEIERVSIELPEYINKNEFGKYEPTAVLNDIGINGDVIPNDNVFSSGGFLIDTSAYVNSSYVYQRFIFKPASVTIRFSNGASEEIDLGAEYKRNIYAAHPNIFLENFKLLVDNEKLQASEYIVNYVTDKSIYYEAWEYGGEIEKATNEFYKYFPDDYHFVVNLIQFNTGSINTAIFGDVRNGIEGLGNRIFDDGHKFGSEKTLTGSIWFPNNFSPGTVVHEMLHNWMIYFPDSLGFSSLYHWVGTKLNSSGFGSILLYKDFQMLEGDTVSALVNDEISWEFNDIELYYMGLLEKDSVKHDIKYLYNPVFVKAEFDKRGNEYHIFTADEIRTTSINDLEMKFGPRISTEDVSEFKLFFLIVYDRKLTERELSLFHYWAKDSEQENLSELWNPYDMNFNQAAHGYATAKTKLETKVSDIEPIDLATNKTDFSIYPNPTNSIINVTLHNPLRKNTSIKIFNVLGQLIIERELINQQNIILDLTDLSSGVYFVNFSSTSFSLTKKITLLK